MKNNCSLIKKFLCINLFAGLIFASPMAMSASPKHVQHFTIQHKSVIKKKHAAIKAQTSRTNVLSAKTKQSSLDLTFNDLVELSKTQNPTGILAEKLNNLLTTSVVDNSLSDFGASELKQSQELAKYIRMTSWNIERGMNLDQINSIFIEPDKVYASINTKKEKNINKIKKQLEIIKNTDIFVLNEVDNGMPRTKYRDVVRDMAKAGKFNYAYGVEFVEVDPVHLGLEDYKWSEERFLFNGPVTVDQAKYKGLHGTAILSKFPIKNVRILRLPEYYDWFGSEVSRISTLEDTKRKFAQKIFKEEMIREIRQGNRMALIADVEIPGVSTPVTIVAVHLENRTPPKNRVEQLKVVLDYIKDIKNPVIMAGDLNTMGSDGSPTSIKKEIAKKIQDKEFWAKRVVLYILPHTAIANVCLTTTNFFRKYSDPTVKNIPILAPNPERKLFDTVKTFKFSDGYTFDFRGNRENSVNHKKKNLADSNERDLKGFVPTYLLKRNFGIGKYKLDWIFVKPYITSPKDKTGPYVFAPHYGRTLLDLNYMVSPEFSDHAPITVDLPVSEPAKK